MAVVQISRVQVRRGRANASSGVPQLSSGELGWAVDVQELYIGNGSIQEGAPNVGNTKILTERSNILGLVGQYTYKNVADANIQTGTAAPITRSLQDRLDETVTVRSFGAVGNGTYNLVNDQYTSTNIVNDTVALQRAITQLFGGLASNRVILELPAGIFVINDSLKVPPFAVLKGAGKDKTIIVQNGNFPVFQTIGSGTSITGGAVLLGDMTIQNQPNSIEISDMTVRTMLSTPVMILDATVNSVFNNVKFNGSWDHADTPADEDCGVLFRARSGPVTCKDNLFNNCDFVKLSYAVNSTFDILQNVFVNCLFESCGGGVLFGKNVIADTAGRSIGPSQNKFLNSKFVDINRQAINVINGVGNLSSNNSFIRVGNNGPSSNTAEYPVIHFGNGSNASSNDQFERSYNLTSRIGFTNSEYVSEVSGVATSDHKFNEEIYLSTTTGSEYKLLLRLPGNESSRINVHYVYKSILNNVVRHGTMYITTDQYNNTVGLSDEFEGSGTGAATLKFKAEYLAGDANTVYIEYNNPVGAETGYINYWYEILS
jgi:hypothetical protein